MAETAVPSAASPQAEPSAAPLRLPIRDIVPWAVLAVVLAAVLIYFVGTEQGATSVFGGTWVHEFTHDGRHLLGFPCH
ncbi:CbtB domain-containing protein [Actinomadura verrucosospora]|uniref:Cobalt transporter n=1 Tax=Actinomadura verrucosospora TaxID=46165 RepID=A0A7D3ZSX6_ACTVE|nr:CbtB-domain containing protein [Actinomadura verrucosospora]QKG25922.1 cobalt transporter [Actinomadura verrucosospora]